MAPKIDERSNTVQPKEYLNIIADLIRSQREIQAATAELAAARGVQAGIYRRAKNAGADVEAIKHLRALAKMEDDERNHLLENVNKYADWEGVKLWVLPTEGVPQGLLFADDPEAMKAAENLQDARVSADAANSRRHGSAVDANPHTPGTRDHQTWATSWLMIDTEIKAKPPKVELASTERRGRGRPKQEQEVVQEPRPRGRPKKIPAALIETRPETVRATIAADDAAEGLPVAEAIPSADVVHFPDTAPGWNN